MRPVAVVVGALAAILALAAVMPRGPALSGDSAVYLSVAESLAQGRGFVQFDGEPYTRWAPLLPVLLAPFTRFGLDAAWAGFGLNLLALLAVLVLLATWLGRHVADPLVRALTLAVLLTSATLLEATVFVWSDLPFLALALAALVGADRLEFADHARRRRLALLGGALVALAVLMRYAGLALVPVGVGLLLSRGPGAPGGRRRAVDAACFAGVALVPIALWCFRNLALVGGAFGPRRPSVVAIAAQGRDLCSALGVWLVGSGQGEAMRVGTGLGLVVVGIALVGLAFASVRRVRSPGPGVPLSVQAAAAYVLVAAAILVGWSSYASIERLNERYTIPLVVPGLLVVAWATDRLRERLAWRAATARLGFVVAVTIGLALAGLGAVRTARHVERYRGPGEWGYNTALWDRSLEAGLLHAVAGLPRDEAVFSNAPDAIYARLRRPARGLTVPPRGGVPEQFWVVHFDTVPWADPDATLRFIEATGPCASRATVWFPDGLRVRSTGCGAAAGR